MEDIKKVKELKRNIANNFKQSRDEMSGEARFSEFFRIGVEGLLTQQKSFEFFGRAPGSQQSFCGSSGIVIVLT